MTTHAHETSQKAAHDLIGPLLSDSAFTQGGNPVYREGDNLPHSGEVVSSPYGTGSLGRVAVLDADSELRTTLTTPDSAQHLDPETGELLVAPEDAPHISTLGSSEKSSKKGLFIGLGAGAAGLAIAAGAFTLGRGSSTPTTQPTPSISGLPLPGPSASETTPTPQATETKPTDLPTITETGARSEVLSSTHTIEQMKAMDVASFEKLSRGDKLSYYSWVTRDRDQITKDLMSIDEDKNNLLVTPSEKNSGQEVLNWNRFDVNMVSLFSYTTRADGGMDYDNQGAIKALNGFIYNSGSEGTTPSDLYTNVKAQIEAQTKRANPLTVYQFISENKKIQRDPESGKDITLRSITHKNLTNSGEGTYVTDFTLVNYTDYQGKPASAWMLVDSRNK